MSRTSLAVALTALLSPVLSTSLLAQADPVGAVHPNAQPLANVQTYAVPALDRVAIALEDEQLEAGGMPDRVAIANQVLITPDTHGTWEALDGSWSLWRLRIQSPGANHVNVGFTRMVLPPGAHLHLYSADLQHVVRRFTTRDQSPDMVFYSPIVRGNDVVCEVYVPTQQKPQLQLAMVHIGSGYRGFGYGTTALQTDGSGSCNVDVVCPDGNGWETQIDSVAHILINGTWICSGAMVNNTAQDQSNYFLTANHCIDQVLPSPSLVFYWNYQNSSCSGGGASLSQFTTGAQLRATWSTSDFALFELNSTPPASYGVTYSGWNRGTGNHSSATCIHHPSGDAKKISHEFQATSVSTNYVTVNDWDVGTTEGGSSGSPLFDQDQRIVGQLCCGAAACGNNFSDDFGRFARSWTGGGTSSTRLSNWLDPIGTGATTLDAYGAGAAALATAYGAGCYGGAGGGDEMFAEQFSSNTFDLAGSASFTSSVVLTPIGGGYQVSAGGNSWFTPLSADLNLNDDDLSSQTLPFTLSHPGGSTNQVRFCSNGFVWLDGTSTGTSWQPSIASLASDAARLAPLWVDLNPTAGGSCHYDVAGTTAYFTWLNVPAYTSGSPGAGNTMQIALHQSGVVEFRYRNFTNQPNAAVLGYSQGAATATSSIDVSASLPFTVGVSGLTWTPQNTPVIGTTQVIQLGGVVNPTQSIGMAVIGFSPILAGLDLSFLGASGCKLYESPDVLEVVFPLIGTIGNWFWAVPNNPSLTGVSVFTQGVLLEAAAIAQNPGGIRTANAVELLIGTN